MLNILFFFFNFLKVNFFYYICLQTSTSRGTKIKGEYGLNRIKKKKILFLIWSKLNEEWKKREFRILLSSLLSFYKKFFSFFFTFF